MGGKSFRYFINLSRRIPPYPPRLPGDWDPGARQEPRTVVRQTGSCRRYPSRRPANWPLRGELQVVTSAVAESDKFKPGLDRGRGGTLGVEGRPIVPRPVNTGDSHSCKRPNAVP